MKDKSLPEAPPRDDGTSTPPNVDAKPASGATSTNGTNTLPEWDWRFLLGAAPDFVLILESDGTVAYINRVLPNLEADTVIGSSAYSYMSAEFAAQLKSALARVFRTGNSSRFEIKSEGPYGSISSYDMHLGPLKTDGRTTHVLVVASDVTDRRRAEEALAQNEAKYRSLTRAIPDLLFRISSVGVYLDFIPAVGMELMTSPEKFVGRFVSDIMPDDVSKKFMSAVGNALRLGETQGLEYELPHEDGVRHFEARIVPDEEHSVLAIVREVTARKKAEMELGRHRAHLQRLNKELLLAEERERRKLARGLHDQIGQILAVARGRLSSIRGNNETALILREVKKLINEAIKQTRTLTFELSSPVLYELGLAAAIESLGEQMPGLERLSFVFESDETAVLRTGDVEVVLYRVTRELLMNVVKHAKARNVRVSVSAQDDEYVILIEDDGIGFEDVRAEEGFTRKGTFGLFAVKEQLEQVGGELRIASTPGRGTSVTVVAPFHRTPGDS